MEVRSDHVVAQKNKQEGKKKWKDIFSTKKDTSLVSTILSVWDAPEWNMIYYYHIRSVLKSAVLKKIFK